MQAVIICGGRGKRLMPITKNIPKILAPVNGKPFIFYILEQLYKQGIKEIVFLTGYLGKKIEKSIQSEIKYNLKFKYVHGLEKWETGRRIWEAKKHLKKNFLILYSDNFTIFNLKKNLSFFKKKNISATLTVAPKKPGNLSLSKNNILIKYSKKRSQNLPFVEIGYIIINKNFLFNQYKDKNCCLSDLIKKISSSKKANAVIQNAYYSISDPKRLLLTEKYLLPKKIILLDRDGVINYKAPKGTYINKWSNFKFIDKTLNLLLKLSQNGYKFIIITNQAGVGRKITRIEDLLTIHKNMIKFFFKRGITVLKVYVCTHHWLDDCVCRKPKPFLFFKASNDFNFRMDKTIYLGDDDRDILAAENAGCKGVLWNNKKKILYNRDVIRVLKKI